LRRDRLWISQRAAGEKTDQPFNQALAYFDFGDDYFVVDRWRLDMNRLQIVVRQRTVSVESSRVVSAWWIRGQLTAHIDVIGLLLARLIHDRISFPRRSQAPWL
jgi:hypothetical protein